jgi:hypothetical protein
MSFAESAWRKSSYSGGTNGNCVEIALTTALVGVRDTKDPDGGRLSFPASAWRAFSRGCGR